MIARRALLRNTIAKFKRNVDCRYYCLSKNQHVLWIKFYPHSKISLAQWYIHSAQIQQLTLVQKWSSAHNIGLGSGPEHDQLVISMNHLLLVCVVCDFWPPSRVCDPLPSYLPPPLASMYASAFRICVFLMDTMSVHVWWYYPSTF